MALARAEALQPRLNVLLHLDAEAVRTAARGADERLRRGEPIGPLHGIPVTLKDLVDVAGVPTTAGSGFLRDLPGQDATVWSRLQAAGAVLLGKAHLHEIAYGSTGINPHHGTSRNPWHMGRITGGSSGGSAAGVASGVGTASIGSDTGGSIRCPAALCGVTGLKPTYGRVSRAGVFPLSYAQDHVGPMTRTALDAALVLDAVGGPDPRDRTTLGVQPARATETVLAQAADLSGVRVGVLLQHRAAVVQDEVGRLFDAAVEQLRSLGAAVAEVDLPEEAHVLDVGVLMLQAEAASVHLPWLRERPEAYGADVRSRLESGSLISAVDYLDAQRARKKLVARVLERFASFDVVVGPTVPVAAPPVEAATAGIGSLAVDPRTVLLRLTRLYNVTGQPAVSIPCGFTADGLPVGVQLAAAPWQEGRLLAIAHAYQLTTDWHQRRPPLD